MDPFTEKLLERTRARRENLQKKMAERPTAANRQMAKRNREPLTESNSVLCEPPAVQVLPSSKPSPSKRRCSDENALISGEENKEPAAPHSMATEPVTDKKPPVAPTSVRSVPPPAVAVRSAPEPEKMELHPQKEEGSKEKTIKPSAMENSREILTETASASPSGFRSRLQRLAEQRQCWDSAGVSDTGTSSDHVSPLKSQVVEVASIPAPTSSGTPIGRKGRLANLAATIGSWEDDLGHPSSRRDNAQGKPGTACVPPPVRAAASISAKACPTVQHQPEKAPMSKPAPLSHQAPVHSPVKSARVIPPSPQKTEVPEPKPVQQRREVPPSPASSPLKNYSSAQPTPRSAVPSSPQKAPISQSPLKKHSESRELDSGIGFESSPQKSHLPSKPSSAALVTQTRDRFAKEVTPLQSRGPAGTPGVKSFLERFGERCQERHQSSPSAGAGQSCTPTVTPRATPNARLVQERLMGTQSTTATADLTQRQKMEREAELAQVRSRFQRGNMWKNKEETVQVKNEPETKVSVQIKSQRQSSMPVVDNTPSAPASEIPSIPEPSTDEISKMEPAETSSPLKKAGLSAEMLVKEETYEAKEDLAEEVYEVEMNVDGSINSEVINNLFEDALGDEEEPSTREEEEDDDEDALNISSMSLLTPLAETVAAVVKSPERKIMTSTPASSFNEKSATPDGISRSSKFQRARVLRAGSSESISTIDEEQNLPYSIDAYRSTRLKETERPHVKQVIVRKEDVSQRMEDPRNPSHISIKQRMKFLTNEMNLQQTVIHQASQALNCCTDEEHGKGSQVEAEAERLLLIATERRVALKAELDRLKGEGPAGQKKDPPKVEEDVGVSPSKGSITLLELRLPLKADFVCSTANKPESGNHYFFVMIRAGAENTVATPLANTRNALSGDALTFSTKFTLSDVSNDFEIDIEVYYLVQKRELNPEKRKKPNKSKAITPKRFLAITKSNLQTPVMASPGGPNAVRSSSFVLVGSHKLTLASIGKTKFPLEKVPFLCPLEGHIYLKMQCEVGSRVEERGFLTMFEDVSGFGAWHRRWCVLSGYCISYWTYPDDEKRKNPIGRINLANCTSRKVEPANREFCARPNTFELITVRPQREDDKETLVSQCMNTMCVTKNWLSADTKAERNLWMQKLNQILVDLRMWQPDSCYRPL
ncbi:anillin [Chanos chanos]|uniref:Anillin n=1 Tax=Chanos chanos TaxID=29144 RepID=A0A6J2WIZ4_CHACN|nr:anillin [Chanos chanos]